MTSKANKQPTKKQPAVKANPVNKKRTEMDKKIVELRNQKKEAIKNLDYDLAEEIDKQIKCLHRELDNYHDDYIQQEFRSKLVQLLNDYSGCLSENQENSKASEMDIRIRINGLFEEMRKRHLEELVNMEKDYAADRLRESERTISDYDVLITQSRHAASQGYFEEARSLQNKANVLQQNDLEARLAKIDREFDAKTKIHIDGQKQEIEQLVHKLEHELQINKDKFYNKEKELLSKKDTTIIGLLQTYGRQIFDTDTLQAIILQECTNYQVPLPEGVGVSVAVQKKAYGTEASSSRLKKTKR